MKKFLIISIAVLVFITSGFLSSASAAISIFEDMSPRHRAYEAALSLTAKGAFEPSGDYMESYMVRPQKQVTRMEAVVMVARLLGIKRETNHPGFRDVTVLNNYYNEVAALAERGIIQGFTDRTMRPNDILTRSQMAKLLVDAFEYEKKSSFTLPFKDVKKENWAAPYVEALVRNKVTSGTTATTFSPDQKLTRAELMMLLHRAYSSKPFSEYNDQEIFSLIREVQNKPYMILEKYKYSQKIRPSFSIFKNEITPYAEGNMLAAMQEFYEISCKDCDWMLYYDVSDNGLPYTIHERSNNKIKVTIRIPEGMDEASTETWTLVNRNGQWKLSEFADYSTAREKPYNLTIQQAKSYLIYAFDNPYSANGLREYVEEIEYLGENDNGNYTFWIKTNVQEAYYQINPKDGVIEWEDI